MLKYIWILSKFVIHHSSDKMLQSLKIEIIQSTFQREMWKKMIERSESQDWAGKAEKV